ncbi:MAG TPA: LysM domain-containing protein [Nocardioides sp.]|nr:LysM domain-containing protein [Nocardioides sp.]
MTSPFPPSSRYAHVPVLTRTLADGTVVRYLARRVLPDLERFAPLEMVRLDGSERPDTLAAESYGDPLLWWRVADASGEADPRDLTGTEGRLVLIPLPLEMTDDGRA